MWYPEKNACALYQLEAASRTAPNSPLKWRQQILTVAICLAALEIMHCNTEITSRLNLHVLWSSSSMAWIISFPTSNCEYYNTKRYMSPVDW